MLFLSMQCFLLLFLSFIGCVLRCSELIKVSYFWSWENYKLYKSFLLMQNKSQPYASNFFMLEYAFSRQGVNLLLFFNLNISYMQIFCWPNQKWQNMCISGPIGYLNKKIYLFNTDFHTKFAEVLSTLCQIHFFIDLY